MINVKIDGVDATILSIKGFADEVDRLALDQVRVTAGRAEKAVRRVLANSGVSEPDEAPGKDTGALQRSVYMRIENSGRTARIGTDLDYGKILEYGSRHMRRRPWLIKTVMKFRKQYFSALNVRIRRAAEKAGGGKVKVRFK